MSKKPFKNFFKGMKDMFADMSDMMDDMSDEFGDLEDMEFSENSIKANGVVIEKKVVNGKKTTRVTVDGEEYAPRKKK